MHSVVIATRALHCSLLVGKLLLQVDSHALAVAANDFQGLDEVRVALTWVDEATLELSHVLKDLQVLDTSLHLEVFTTISSDQMTLLFISNGQPKVSLKKSKEVLLRDVAVQSLASVDEE